MENQSLTPATQAVLTALAELGQGNVHELAEKSGKARSTTDKAIKTLTDAGMIVAVDLGADAAEGTPIHWTLSDDAAAALDAADLSDEPAAGLDDTDDDPDSASTDEADTDASEPFTEDAGGGQAPDTGDNEATDDGQETPDEDEDDEDPEGVPVDDRPRTTAIAAPRPGDRKVMAIKGVLADHSDGASLDVIVAESGISHTTAIRLLAAMEQADAARRLPGLPERWTTGPTKASEVDPNPEPPRCALCFQVIRGVTSTPAAVAAVQSLIRTDGTLHVLGSDDEVHVVPLPTRLPPRTVNNNSSSAVGYRSVTTVNADGNQPFGRGELEKLTVAVLADNPGRPMTPQEIATVISAKLGGRNVSSGAVRNNCTKTAAAGSILLVSEAPLTFVLPAPAADNTTDKQASGDQPDTSDGAGDAADTGMPAHEDGIPS